MGKDEKIYGIRKTLKEAGRIISVVGEWYGTDLDNMVDLILEETMVMVDHIRCGLWAFPGNKIADELKAIWKLEEDFAIATAELQNYAMMGQHIGSD